jgi:hypothetical protein
VLVLFQAADQQSSMGWMFTAIHRHAGAMVTRATKATKGAVGYSAHVATFAAFAVIATFISEARMTVCQRPTSCAASGGAGGEEVTAYVVIQDRRLTSAVV